MKTTPEDFELFKAECQKWIEYFGLIDWRAIYYHGEIIDSHANAEWEHNVPGKIISFTLNSEMEEYHPIPLVAFHEVVEGILLAYLTQHIDTKYIDYESICRDRHTIVRTLENTIYKDINCQK